MKRSASALLLLLPIVTGWLSISQARYGATLDDLRDQTYMQSTANADRSIGWLWSAPRSQTDSRGLGQSITWAWDPKLCDMILGSFKSDAFGIPMLGCESIKVAMHRAFMTWSQVRRAIYYFILVTPSLAATFVARFFILQNHPMISFTEVTTLCEETGQLHEQCTHAEVWVTYRNVSRDGSTGGVSGAVQAAVALPTHAITTDFYHTNGQQPTMELSVSGTSIQVPKQTIEVRVGSTHSHQLSVTQTKTHTSPLPLYSLFLIADRRRPHRVRLREPNLLVPRLELLQRLPPAQEALRPNRSPRDRCGDSVHAVGLRRDRDGCGGAVGLPLAAQDACEGKSIQARRIHMHIAPHVTLTHTTLNTHHSLAGDGRS